MRSRNIAFGERLPLLFGFIGSPIEFFRVAYPIPPGGAPILERVPPGEMEILKFLEFGVRVGNSVVGREKSHFAVELPAGRHRLGDSFGWKRGTVAKVSRWCARCILTWSIYGPISFILTSYFTL
jgi:hypothetical protein